MHLTEDDRPQISPQSQPQANDPNSICSDEFSLLESECDEPLAKAFHSGLLRRMLEEYVALCHPPAKPDESRPRTRTSASSGDRFPNLAGFCRFLGCSTEEWLAMERDHPIPFGRLRAVLEDEALNATLSPTVIGAYLKRRLGYDNPTDSRAGEHLTVRFEHDIWEDGE